MNAITSARATKQPTQEIDQFPAVSDRTILIIEQDTSLRFLLDQAMQKAHYNTICVSYSTEIHSILEKTPIDLILIDVATNHWDDFNVCRGIRQHFPTPIAILSSHSQASVQKRIKQLGGTIHLTKPFRLSQLLQSISALLREEIR